MSNCQKNEGNNNNTKEGFDWWKIGGLAAAGFGAAATYFYINSQKEPEARHSQRSSSSSSNNECRVNSHSSTMNSSQIQFEAKGIKNVPENPIINNLNSILSDIYVRYVAIKRDDFRLHYRVFDKIFYCLHQKMKKVDKYYNRYSGMVQFGGSHYDGLRITKPDEFDMHIVIGMPLNINTDRLNHDNSDIIFEPTEAGFIQFKMGSQYTNLLYRDNWDIHQTCYKWKDENNYLLRSKFSDWFKSVVVRALNDFDERLYGLAVFTIDGSQYTIDRSESGPAITLKIKNRFTGFSMDVDLVPSLRFPESRWPITPAYREIPPNCKKDFFMVVPKMDKNSTDAVKKTRSWRLALHYQERELIYDSKNLRTAIKLLKKLRDTLDMSKIASYYIKMLVYGEVVRRNDSSFGTKSIADLFKIFVDVFHRALVAKKIPFLWNEDNNLLDGVSPITLDIYAGKLQKLKRILEVPSDYRQVAKFLLTPYEYSEYNMRYLMN